MRAERGGAEVDAHLVTLRHQVLKVLALLERARVSRWTAFYRTRLSHDAIRTATVVIDRPSCFGQLCLTHRDCARARFRGAGHCPLHRLTLVRRYGCIN
jgi:hypothetical protein